MVDPLKLRYYELIEQFTGYALKFDRDANGIPIPSKADAKFTTGFYGDGYELSIELTLEGLKYGIVYRPGALRLVKSDPVAGREEVEKNVRSLVLGAFSYKGGVALRLVRPEYIKPEFSVQAFRAVSPVASMNELLQAIREKKVNNRLFKLRAQSGFLMDGVGARVLDRVFYINWHYIATADARTKKIDIGYYLDYDYTGYGIVINGGAVFAVTKGKFSIFEED